MSKHSITLMRIISTFVIIQMSVPNTYFTQLHFQALNFSSRVWASLSIYFTLQLVYLSSHDSFCLAFLSFCLVWFWMGVFANIFSRKWTTPVRWFLKCLLHSLPPWIKCMTGSTWWRISIKPFPGIGVSIHTRWVW